MDNKHQFSRRDALLAAAPHLLMALLFALSTTSSPLPAQLFRFLLPFAIAVALIFAWRSGWPTWAGSWIGYTFYFGLVMVNWLAGAPLLLYLAAGALLVAGLILFQRRPLLGLLALVPALILVPRFWVFELVTGGEYVMAALWLLLALVAALIIRLRAAHATLLLLIAFQLISGLAFTWGHYFLPLRWPEGVVREIPPFQSLANHFLPATLLTITIPLALLLLKPLHQTAQAGGRWSRRNHWMLLSGTLITFIVFLALYSRPTRPSTLPLTDYVLLCILGITIGLLLSVTAAWLLARNSSHSLLLPLLVAFAPFVVLALPPPFAPDGSYGQMAQTRIFLSYTAVLAWTALALLALLRDRPTRRSSALQPSVLHSPS